MKVADMTVEDLRFFVEQTFLDLIGDPDANLELNEDFISRLIESIDDKAGRMTHEEFLDELKKDSLV
ncbi:hypothetical protein [Candidatus Magnetominusculus xianensis]|uniref:Uncharacterized protein n=1 Tax=Candidatus Magnetominusculus xianensis TaxID=1748249 RepID=A0ABR5SG24_9BACT|nr:hypothetical protein [Candidatus Magnetominusculus xianensis]KWT87232.1 hypothetical protein ASN18_1348 [Candidatus Magnetominusculus xianensis]MBF0405069.1 hypothetical protein [Nitrospirota bacterium]